MDYMGYHNNQSSSPAPKDEPTIENDYGSHPEFEQPNPSTATPSIPQEMPVR